MTRVVALVLFGVAVLVVAGVGQPAGGAPVPKHLAKKADGDKAKLQGKWRVESLKMGDQDILGLIGREGFEMIIEFQGDQFLATANIQNSSQKSTAAVKYDPAKKQLSMTNPQTVGADGKPINAGQKDATMGYAFDGDKLLIATSPGGTGAADPLKPGKSDIVMVLGRVKEK